MAKTITIETIYGNTKVARGVDPKFGGYASDSALATRCLEMGATRPDTIAVMESLGVSASALPPLPAPDWCGHMMCSWEHPCLGD